MEKTPFYERSHSKFLDDNRTITCLGKRAPEDDWEERAFAEDAAGGGCVWPPRSYFCSFCKREFRSAQALGGHMNVHRRDRAKLKNNTFSTTNENKGFCFDFRNPNSQLKVTMANNCSNELLCRVEDHLFSSNNPKKFENKVDAFHLRDDDEDETICRKRRRLTNEDEDEDEHQKVEVNGINSCSIIRELDLELRLGDGPKTCKNTLSSLLT